MKTGLALLVAAVTVAAAAQQPAAPALDAATKKQVLDGAIDHMRRAYIFADVAEKMAEAVRGFGIEAALRFPAWLDEGDLQPFDEAASCASKYDETQRIWRPRHS